ncbi:MAG: peptidoglycan-associated lipoprotein Pal [Rhodospirillaceae bacterium]|nr:MAG: peptidoglycan-associated lipoprotein Pal [Rhodospirillaceae bacterium]
MNLRFLSVVAVAVLLAACASKKEQAAGTATSAPMAQAPSGPAPDSVEYFNQVVGNTVNFDFDKYDLRPDAQAILRGQAAWLNQNPSRTVTVEGHCDERGTKEYNLGLGNKRAKAVMQYLVSLGVSSGRLKTISYGKERPLCVASEESCWTKNRRGVSAVQ